MKKELKFSEMTGDAFNEAAEHSIKDVLKCVKRIGSCLDIVVDCKIPQNQEETFRSNLLDAVSLASNVPKRILEDSCEYVCGVDPAREHGDKSAWMHARRMKNGGIEIVAEGECPKISNGDNQ